MTKGSSFSSCGETKGEGWAPTLPLAHNEAASPSSSFQASTPWERSTVEMQASSSHQSCKAKQKGPAATYSELGCSHYLISTRILAHLRFRRWAVFSSTTTNLPQESPNFLKRLLPQRCRGRPRILTQTRHRSPLSPLKQPTEGFHFSRQKLLPLKRLAPD